MSTDQNSVPNERSRVALLLRELPWFVHYVFAVGIATLCVLGLVIYRVESRVEQASSWRSRTLRVTSVLSDLRFQLSDLESQQRGLILTGDPRFFDLYREALQRVDQDMILLRQLTTDGGQRNRLDRLQPLVAACLDHHGEVLDAWRRNGVGAAGRMILAGRDPAFTGEIPRLLRTLEKGQVRLLAYGEERLWTSLQRARWTLLVGLLWSVPPLALLYCWLLRRLRQWKEMLIEFQQAKA